MSRWNLSKIVCVIIVILIIISIFGFCVYDYEQKQAIEDEEEMNQDELYLGYLEQEKNVFNSLKEEYESLYSEIDTYELYIENREAVWEYYNKIDKETTNFYIGLVDYVYNYCMEVRDKDEDKYLKYNDISKLYKDVLYDGINGDFYDDIHGYLIDHIYHTYYYGILADRPDGVDYEEYEKVRDYEYRYYMKLSNNFNRKHDLINDNIYDLYNELKNDLEVEDYELYNKDLNEFKERLDYILDYNNEN